MPKTASVIAYFIGMVIGIILAVGWTRYGPGVQLTQDRVCPDWLLHKIEVKDGK